MAENQNKSKPPIEEIVSEYLESDALKNVLDFVEWSKANKIKPSFGSKSKVGVSYTTHVYYLKLSKGDWYLWISGKNDGVYENDFFNCEELKEIVWESLALCNSSCAHRCNSGLGFKRTVCGREFEKLCGCCTIRFHSPDVDTLEKIKKVIETRKKYHS